MADIILLISPQTIKDRSGLHTNVDDKLIRPEIEAAQDIYVMPTLGSTLYAKLLSDIDAGTLIDPYLYLVNTYLINCLMNYVLYTLPTALNNQFYNKGVSASSQEQGNTNTNQDNLTVNNQYRIRAEFYKERMRNYLRANMGLFPEFSAYVAGLDVVPPERTTFTLPIYLGGDCDPKPSNNYNDCCK